MKVFLGIYAEVSDKGYEQILDKVKGMAKIHVNNDTSGNDITVEKVRLDKMFKNETMYVEIPESFQKLDKYIE